MKSTVLFEKKLNLFLRNAHELREMRFVEAFLFPGFKFSLNGCGLYLKDLERFGERCHSFNVQIIGLEIHPDSDYPFYVFCYEDYGQKYTPDWIKFVINQLRINNVDKHIIPYVNIPKEVLDYYLTDDVR